MTNSADPDQLASSEMFLHCLAKTGHVVFSERRVRVSQGKYPKILTINVSEQKKKKKTAYANSAGPD